MNAITATSYSAVKTIKVQQYYLLSFHTPFFPSNFFFFFFFFFFQSFNFSINPAEKGGEPLTLNVDLNEGITLKNQSTVRFSFPVSRQLKTRLTSSLLPSFPSFPSSSFFFLPPESLEPTTSLLADA